MANIWLHGKGLDRLLLYNIHFKAPDIQYQKDNFDTMLQSSY